MYRMMTSLDGVAGAGGTSSPGAGPRYCFAPVPEALGPETWAKPSVLDRAERPSAGWPGAKRLSLRAGESLGGMLRTGSTTASPAPARTDRADPRGGRGRHSAAALLRARHGRHGVVVAGGAPLGAGGARGDRHRTPRWRLRLRAWTARVPRGLAPGHGVGAGRPDRVHLADRRPRAATGSRQGGGGGGALSRARTAPRGSTSSTAAGSATATTGRCIATASKRPVPGRTRWSLRGGRRQLRYAEGANLSFGRLRLRPHRGTVPDQSGTELVQALIAIPPPSDRAGPLPPVGARVDREPRIDHGFTRAD
jgi:hypothetical protein